MTLIFGCTIVFYNTYRIPTFSVDKIGIYISRFEGDPLDVYQDKISDAIKGQINNLSYNLYGMEVSDLPRRLKTDFDAQQYGQQGQSYLVLWEGASQADCKDNGIECNKLKITPIKTRLLKPQTGWTVYDNLPKTIGRFSFGHIGKDNLSRAIVEFLMGYYSFTTIDANTSKAIKHLKNSLDALDDGQNETVSLPFKASVLFYLGNAHLKCYLSSNDPVTDCNFDSEKNISKNIGEHYEGAAKIFSEGNELENSYYVEALVNLAFLKLQPHIGNNNLLVKRSNEANKYLELAKQVCEKKVKIFDIEGYSPDTSTCLIVHYSQGVAQQNLTQYDESILAFNKALALLEEIRKQYFGQFF